MAEKTCTGDCLRCSVQQQIYCAAQHGHAILAAVPALVERLDRLEAAVAGFAGASGDIINPLGEKAQNGSGAENREPEQLIIPDNGL